MPAFPIPVGSVSELVVTVEDKKVVVTGICTGGALPHPGQRFEITLQGGRVAGSFVCPGCGIRIEADQLSTTREEEIATMVRMGKTGVMLSLPGLYVQIQVLAHGLTETQRQQMVILCLDEEQFGLTVDKVQAVIADWKTNVVLINVVEGNWVVVPL